MAELQERHELQVEWLPYELRPEPLPLPDLSGPEGDRFRANWARGVAPLAEQFGVEMHFTPVKPRSRKAHEAAEFAREHGAFEQMRVALFRAYFVEGRDLSQPEVLLDVARSVGLDADALRAALEMSHYAERVDELEEMSRRLGVQAVPTIIIGGLAVEGARPYSVLQRVLEEVQRRAEHEENGA